MKAIAGTGVVVVGAEEEMAEVPQERILPQNHKTLHPLLPRWWLTLPPSLIPQRNSLRLPGQTQDQDPPKEIPRRRRRIQLPFHLRQAPDLQTGEGDLNREDHQHSHQIMRANSLASRRRVGKLRVNRRLPTPQKICLLTLIPSFPQPPPLNSRAISMLSSNASDQWLWIVHAPPVATSTGPTTMTACRT